MQTKDKRNILSECRFREIAVFAGKRVCLLSASDSVTCCIHCVNLTSVARYGMCDIER